MGGTLRNAWKVSAKSGRLWTDYPLHHNALCLKLSGCDPHPLNLRSSADEQMIHLQVIAHQDPTSVVTFLTVAFWT